MPNRDCWENTTLPFPPHFVQVSGEVPGFAPVPPQVVHSSFSTISISFSQPKDRYLLISKDRVTLSGADKISICFEAPDACGSLYHLMSHLTYNNLNMNAVLGLRDEARNFKILGNYR